MKLRNKNKDQITVYQARNGSVQLLFGDKHIQLSKKQIEVLLGSHVYDIEDFELKDYQKFYN